MARPALDKKEKREKCINVALSASEYERVLELMDEVGFDSPAVFMRTSALRTQIPPKIVLPSVSKETFEKITHMLNLLYFIRKDFEICKEFDDELKSAIMEVKGLAIIMTKAITKQYEQAQGK